ncbi:hypothetical protein HELRODRAFT_186292 [Helobdella robusta]|uniref:Tubulin-specific chaperone D n=1 Tax=Helobdella robusta TaxID=6412 RepID=T1FNX7_HELRO|nr:hypothetical protein HELRODRAFT_186292 [Helobdella robusta]ESO09741.1 hypothetical protein HELRODRAFT_186292 [Helobdella robusta]
MDEDMKKECFLEEFKEAREINLIVDGIRTTAKKPIKSELVLQRFNFVISQYQEQPHLLDRHLKQLFDKLLVAIKENTADKTLVHFACKFLYILIKTRGYKAALCMFPHEVTDLQHILTILHNEDLLDFEGFECRYVCFLWLSIVCLIPFHLSRFDDASNANKTTLNVIFDLVLNYLDSNNRCQDASAFVLARFLSRPDVRHDKLPLFISWAIQQFRERSGVSTVQKMMGLLIACASLFKVGPRDQLILYGGVLMNEMMELKVNIDANTKVRKLALKVVQRIGLVHLKPRLADWRYKRGCRNLVDNLKMMPTAAATAAAATTAGDDNEVLLSSSHTNSIYCNDDKDDDAGCVPDIVETVIETLLLGLKDKDTSCRWSAAKGIGRITSRLPLSLADEVLSSVMELFTSTSNEDAWHGGCLCLGELGHRGALLPQKLDDVVDVVVRSLNYDERHGLCSVGCNVRDAASFICWSFARAFEPAILSPYMKKVITSLLITCLFDREVKVRRAASAAMQELIGRQGSVVNGIELVTSCDYFAVGSRSNCYLHLSKLISSYEEYRQPIVDHLIKNKLSHWDINVRELAAEALGQLTEMSFNYFVDSGGLSGILLECCTPADLPNSRHGAVLSSAHIIHSISIYATNTLNRTINEVLSPEVIESIEHVISKANSLNYFRGYHGDMMKKACCFFMKQVSSSKFSASCSDMIDSWMSLLNECMHNEDPSVQEWAIDASTFIIDQYFKSDLHKLGDLMLMYMEELQHVQPHVRCAFCRAVGHLPLFALQMKTADNNEQHLFQQLLRHCIHPSLILRSFQSLMNIRENVVDGAFQIAAYKTTVEERKDAIHSVARLCQNEEFISSCLVSDVLLATIYQILFISVNDYTVDDRGDVGAWVRESCMQALYDITATVLKTDLHRLTPRIYLKIFQSFVQQSCEKIDRTRSLAGNLFYKLLYHIPAVPQIPEMDRLKDVFKYKEKSMINWSSPKQTFPLFAQLLSSRHYSYHVTLGFVVSVGGLTESLVKCSAENLIKQLKLMPVDDLKSFCDVFIRLFEDHHKSDRVIVPIFKTIDKLITSDCFANLDECCKNEFMMQLVKLTISEITKCKDVKKILPSIDILCGLMDLCPESRSTCLSRLMILLCHGYPILRKTSASRMYETFMSSESICSAEVFDEVTNILINTNWDMDVSELRPIRNELCDLLGIPHPLLLKTN